MLASDDQYILEIYEGNSLERDVLVTYESPYPFPALQTGQIIRPLGHGEQPAGRVLMIRHVEHIVSPFTGRPTFKMCVYTKPVSDHPHDWDDVLNGKS